MTSLSVEAEDGETVIFGKSVEDLQSAIDIDEDEIGGHLKYVTDYTGFSPSDPELQEGNFIALKFTATAGATTTVEILGGHSGAVELDSDMNWVGRIESTEQKIKVVCSKDGMAPNTKIFDLSSLVLETE